MYENTNCDLIGPTEICREIFKVVVLQVLKSPEVKVRSFEYWFQT